MALKIKVEFQKLKSVLSSLNLKAPLQFQNLSITDVLIDSDSKNLFFLEGDNGAVIINISESLAFLAGKEITDSMAMAEQANLEAGLAKGDTFSVAESISTLLIFERQFSDTFSMSESSVQDTEPNKSDTTNILENYTSAFSTEKSDSYSVDESSDVVPNKIIGNPNTGSTITYIVSVASGVNSYGGGNKYYFNGGVSPEIDLELGGTYRFDQSHSSNGGHPLRFSTTANGTHGGGSEYTTGVTIVGVAGQAGAYVEIDFNTFVNSLHYYCSVHSGMGNKIVTRDEQSISVSESFSKVTDYIRSLTDAYSLDDQTSASDELGTSFGINKGNVFSMLESLTLSEIGKLLSDTTNVSEDFTYQQDKPISDSLAVAEAFAYLKEQGQISNSVSVSESINVQLFLGGASSVLNASTTNTYSINS